MIKTLLVTSTLIAPFAMAVEGYKDHFLDREQDIYIHSILCGDLNNLASLKPAFVYNNSQSIEEGTFYYSSKYGNYSYTFKQIEGQPEQLKLRGLLSAGQTKKEQMKIDYCIVKPIEGSPPALNSKLTQLQLSANDASWAKTMEQYALVAGRPAFAAEQYQDPRAKVIFAQYDLQFYQNNLAILKDLENRFEQQASQYKQALPEQFEQALAYAKQEDGATKDKVYPAIAEPSVWTPTSKEIYNDQVRKQQHEREYDVLIQQTFDWLFSKIGKDSELISSEITDIKPEVWVEAQRLQTITLSNKFNNGRMLDLIFVIKSAKVNVELFESLESIEEKSNIKRQSLDIQRNEPRVKLAGYDNLDVYSPVNKINLFFSQFRADSTLVSVE